MQESNVDAPLGRRGGGLGVAKSARGEGWLGQVRSFRIAASLCQAARRRPNRIWTSYAHSWPMTRVRAHLAGGGSKGTTTLRRGASTQSEA